MSMSHVFDDILKIIFNSDLSYNVGADIFCIDFVYIFSCIINASI